MNITLILDKEEKKIEINEGLTIKDLINDLAISSQTVVSKKNYEIVLEDELIEDGDTIEIIQVIYGG